MSLRVIGAPQGVCLFGLERKTAPIGVLVIRPGGAGREGSRLRDDTAGDQRVFFFT
jgi:hypothetical protein